LRTPLLCGSKSGLKRGRIAKLQLVCNESVIPFYSPWARPQLPLIAPADCILAEPTTAETSRMADETVRQMNLSRKLFSYNSTLFSIHLPVHATWSGGLSIGSCRGHHSLRLLFLCRCAPRTLEVEPQPTNSRWPSSTIYDTRRCIR